MTTQLALFAYCQERVDRTNRQRWADDAARQLARLGRCLAERVEPEPRYRRCDVCQGRMDTQAPHRHAA